MSEDYRKLDRRVKSVEEAIQLLTQMALRADERIDGLDERTDTFNASLNNLTVKMEALVDAQIRTEEILTAKIETLAAAQTRTEEILAAKINALANAQIRTEEILTTKIEALSDAQIRTEEAHARLEEAHTRLEEAFTRLAESERNLAERQAHTDGRLDALIDIIRKEREGRDERREGTQ
jgi:chromosome segregation ATPase